MVITKQEEVKKMENREMKIINLTPHSVKVEAMDGGIVEIPPSGQLLRLPETVVSSEEITVSGKSVKVNTKALNIASVLPPKQEGVLYIVSLPVAQVCDREDFVIPDDLVRDDKGQPSYARRLAKIIKSG